MDPVVLQSDRPNPKKEKALQLRDRVKPGNGINIIGSVLMAKNRCDLQKVACGSGRELSDLELTNPTGGPSTAPFPESLVATIEAISIAMVRVSRSQQRRA
jgi:hypothetical protein